MFSFYIELSDPIFGLRSGVQLMRLRGRVVRLSIAGELCGGVLPQELACAARQWYEV